MGQKKSLRSKLILSLFIACGIPLIVFAVISQVQLRKSSSTNLHTKADAELSKASQCMDMALDKYETILYDLATDDTFVQTLEEINTAGDDLGVKTYTLRSEFSHVCNRNKGVQGVQVVRTDGSRIFYDRLSSSSVNSSWIEKVVCPDTSQVLTYLVDPVQKGTEKNPVFHIVRKIIDYQDIHVNIGYVILSVDVNVLENAIETKGNSSIYLSKDGQIISSPDMKQLGAVADKLYTDDDYVQETVDAKTGWNIIHSQPLASYRAQIHSQTAFWFLAACIMLSVLVCLIYRVTRPLMGSVDDIVSAMGQMEAGDFQVKLPVKPDESREIWEICGGLEELAGKTDQLLNQVKQSALDQKNAEISALEAQIDPHFLYNILDTINWKAIENEQYEISELLAALADILRYAIRNPGEETTIAAEEEWLKKYMLLQQARLGESIKVEFLIEDGLEKCGIHKMLLQPFIENAVKYGFRNQAGEHILKVSIKEAGEQLHIQIENNGVPISQEEVKRLNQGAEQKGHIGIANVRKRLKLYYSDQAVLYFESLCEEELLTRVHLFLPICEKGEAADENSGS